MSRPLQPGDRVRYTERFIRDTRTYWTRSGGFPHTRDTATVLQVYEQTADVRWDCPGIVSEAGILVSNLELAVSHPFSDLSHLPHWRPSTEARVLCDWLRENEWTVTAPTVLSSDPEVFARALEAVAKFGPEAMALCVACGYEPPQLFVAVDYGSSDQGAAVIVEQVTGNEGETVTRIVEEGWQAERRRLDELARTYHEETEAYDRSVCTGPEGRDGIMPANSREQALISANARRVFEVLAAECGDPQALRRAIAQYRPRRATSGSGETLRG
jgi:hypothetical protein